MASSDTPSGSGGEDEFVRKQFTLPEWMAEEVLETLSEDHFDGNSSRAIRASIQSEKTRRETDVDTVELKIMRNKVESINKSVQEIKDQLEDTSEQAKEMTAGVDQTTRLKNAVAEKDRQSESPSDARKVADIIRSAEDPLTVGNIAARAELELPDLHRILEKLLTAGVIDRVEMENGSYKYHTANAGVNA